MEEQVIRLVDVNLSLETRKIFSGLSLYVGSGEAVTILGGRGSGKSLLLKLITGLLKPDSGRILIEGRDISSL